MLDFKKRGHSYRLDGEPVPSVTTLLKGGFPAPALVTWAAKTVAETAVTEWDDLATRSAVERYERLKAAPWGKRDAAAIRGTELHAIGDAITSGEPVEVPPAYEGIAQRYADWLDAWGAEVYASERAVLHLASSDEPVTYAGTFDLIADLDDGCRWLLDIKTGTGVYESHVLQLAAYRFATHLLHASGDLIPMPTVDRVGVIHVQPDSVRLIPVAADRRAMRAFVNVCEVAEWANAAREAWKDRRPWPVGLPIEPEVRAV